MHLTFACRRSGPSSAVAAAKLPLAWALGGPLASVPSRHNSDSAAPLSSFTQAQPRSGNATAARSTADALGKLLNRVGWMPASVPAREGKEAQRPAVPSPPPELPGCRFHALPPGLLAAGGRSALGAAPADAAHGNALHAMSQQPLQHPRQALLPGGQARSFQTSVGPFGGGGGFNFPLTPTNVLILANVAIFALQLYGGLGIMGSFAQVGLYVFSCLFNANTIGILFTVGRTRFMFMRMLQHSCYCVAMMLHGSCCCHAVIAAAKDRALCVTVFFAVVHDG